jgi:multicomponent Na+:H+ antiporter subunit C
MELPMAAAVAALFGAGTYMILRPNLIRLAMGFSLYSNGVNLLLITAGGYTRTLGAPFVGEDPQSAAGLMDPLPPDIILTAIVISFAVLALMLIMCYRVYLDHGTDDPQQLPTEDEHDAADEPVPLTATLGFAPAVGPGNHPPAYDVPSHAPGSHGRADRREDR